MVLQGTNHKLGTFMPRIAIETRVQWFQEKKERFYGRLDQNSWRDIIFGNGEDGYYWRFHDRFEGSSVMSSLEQNSFILDQFSGFKIAFSCFVFLRIERVLLKWFSGIRVVTKRENERAPHFGTAIKPNERAHYLGRCHTKIVDMPKKIATALSLYSKIQVTHPRTRNS